MVIGIEMDCEGIDHVGQAGYIANDKQLSLLCFDKLHETVGMDTDDDVVWSVTSNSADTIYSHS